MSKISAVINTKNASEFLDRCLQSLNFVDEIIVADMNSQDKTCEIAKKYHAKCFNVPESNHVELVRNEAIVKATHPWVLVIDADECIPSALAAKLRSITAGMDSTASAFKIARKNIVFGAWIKHSGWWPDYQIRFFKKGAVSWSGQIHQQPSVTGSIQVLPATEDIAIEHNNYRTIDEFYTRMQRYTRSETEKIQSTPLDTPITSASLLTTFFHDFFSRYYQSEGYKDGLHGTSLALLQSFYQVTTQLRNWEKNNFAASASEISNKWIQQLLRDWQYWQTSKMANQSRGLVRMYWLLRKKLRI